MSGLIAFVGIAGLVALASVLLVLAVGADARMRLKHHVAEVRADAVASKHAVAGAYRASPRLLSRGGVALRRLWNRLRPWTPVLAAVGLLLGVSLVAVGQWWRADVVDLTWTASEGDSGSPVARAVAGMGGMEGALEPQLFASTLRQLDVYLPPVEGQLLCEGAAISFREDDVLLRLVNPATGIERSETFPLVGTAKLALTIDATGRFVRVESSSAVQERLLDPPACLNLANTQVVATDRAETVQIRWTQVSFRADWGAAALVTGVLLAMLSGALWAAMWLSRPRPAHQGADT